MTAPGRLIDLVQVPVRRPTLLEYRLGISAPSRWVEVRDPAPVRLWPCGHYVVGARCQECEDIATTNFEAALISLAHGGHWPDWATEVPEKPAPALPRPSRPDGITLSWWVVWAIVIVVVLIHLA